MTNDRSKKTDNVADFSEYLNFVYFVIKIFYSLSTKCITVCSVLKYVSKIESRRDDDRIRE